MIACRMLGSQSYWSPFLCVCVLVCCVRKEKKLWSWWFGWSAVDLLGAMLFEMKLAGVIDGVGLMV